MSHNDVVLTWERGPKLLFTRPVKVDRQTRKASFNNESLSQEITLFKKKKAGATFEPKPFKFTLRQNSEKGKVLGKIDINFSDYVEIPSFNKRIAAELSSGSRVVLRVKSDYIGEAKGRGSSRGTASIGSFDPASDGQSSVPIEEEDHSSEVDGDLNLDDLNLDDDDDDDPVPPAPLPPVAQPVIKKVPSLLRRKPSTASEESSRGISQVRRQLSKQHRRQTSGLSASSADSGGGGARGRRGDSDLNAANVGGISKVDYDKLRRENRMLKRKNEDLSQRNLELEDRIEEGNRSGNAEEIERLLSENKTLKRDLEDVEAQLRREPVYADVVRDLREAKMALAILSLEKDQLIQELRKRKGGR